MNSHHVTTGGVLIGLLAIAVVIVPWYRKNTGGKGRAGLEKGAGGRKRDWAALGPFFWVFVLGTLSSLAVGGIIGQTALRIDQGSNTLGDQVLSAAAGADSPGVTRAGIAMLQPGGAVLLILVLIGCLIWFWISRRPVKWQMLMGLLAGCTLGPTAGIAGVAGVIAAPVFNFIGAYLVGIGAL
jgi:hypothetical protein